MGSETALTAQPLTIYRYCYIYNIYVCFETRKVNCRYAAKTGVCSHDNTMHASLQFLIIICQNRTFNIFSKNSSRRTLQCIIYTYQHNQTYPNDANTPPHDSHDGGNAADIVKIYITRRMLADLKIYY